MKREKICIFYDNKKNTFVFQSVLYQQVKYCGTTLPHRFLSVEGAVQIKFKSDGNGNGQGFKLEYSLPSKIFSILKWVAKC